MLRPLLFFLAGLLAVAPGRGLAQDIDAATAAARGILLLSNGTEPAGLDPHTVTGIPEHKIISALMEGLVAEHPTSDTDVEPGVAERWESSPDGLRWTFHLRPTARWSNGDPVTAGDFVYAYRRILTAELGSKYADFLYLLAGAEDYHAGRTTDFGTVGVSAPDARTLVLTLRAPAPFFLQSLKHYTFFPVHPPTIEAFGAFRSRTTDWAMPGNHVGNGPFRLREWQTNRVLVVERSPTYWDAERVGLNEIRYYPIENRDTESRAFSAGQLHVTDSVPLAERRVWRDRADPRYRQDRQFATGYLLLNVRSPGLERPAFRRALSLAIDRETLVFDVLAAGEPATSFTPAGIDGYTPGPMPEFDPVAARAALAEAGFGPGGPAAPRLRFLITTSDTTRTLAEALQGMWREHLGLEVALRNMEWKVLLSTLDQRDYDLSFLIWYGDYVDPHSFASLMQSASGNNRTQWGHPRYDALVDASLLIRDRAERLDTLRQAEDLLLAELPIVPIYWVTHNFLVHPALEGYGPKLLDQRPWKHLRLRAP